MTARELRAKYLAFFESKGHTRHFSGSLIPYDVTGRLDESLLFNGAGMVQFKPFFRGIATPSNLRLATAQKCVRTGDIESVGNLSHLTFFEMLGNFSFGDYFKKEAIDFSWEFLTSPQWLGLDPKRLSFTVFEEDDEAYACWEQHVKSAGIKPETRIFRLGEETNYWPAGAFSSGPPGPCGPNSEMFYWTSNDTPPPTIDGTYTTEEWLADDAAKNWLEIWNDVFIQFEWQGELKNPERPSDGYQKLAMPNLPFQSIDTGMGLERTSAVLNGFSSVYDTDLFQPILSRISAETKEKTPYRQLDESKARAARIIADHIRTACFCIADGILPGNSGRGYVLRRLIRRAILKGSRVLGFEDLFLYKMYDGVLEAVGDHYQEIGDRRDVIIETLRNEEALFRRTLANGISILQQWIAVSKGSALSGEAAFQLYDTYGFPLEVTQELCEEAGLSVDIDGYEIALKEAQDRSRGAHGMDTVYGGVAITFQFTKDETKPTPTQFLGYELTEAAAHIVGILPIPDENGNPTQEIAVALDQSPFYAESGGQVSDSGFLSGDGYELEVVDLVKQDGVYVHVCKPIPECIRNPQFGDHVMCRVNSERRRQIIRNHTATHLLHAALREVLGTHVTQAGSLVEPRHLRFDFTHGKALTKEELAEVERRVNMAALAGYRVAIHTDVPISDAKSMGAMALFGEKYGDRVRVVDIRTPSGEKVSAELCGGIHVSNTAEIGLFKILHEASAASGVRRIEAVTGDAAYEWANRQQQIIRDAADRLRSTPGDLLLAIDKNLEALKEEKRKVEKLRSASAEPAKVEPIPIGNIELVVQKIDDMDGKEAGLLADRLADNQPKRVTLVIATQDGKITLTAKAGPDAVASKAHAGNLVKSIAQILGGGGGGRPDFATAGGRDLSKLDEAVSTAPKIVADQVGA